MTLGAASSTMRRATSTVRTEFHSKNPFASVSPNLACKAVEAHRSAYGVTFFFGGAAGAFLLAASPPDLLSKVKASLALNGKRRTDCSPVVLRVMSTRRLLA